jgi:hypothetical protein
MQYNFGEIPLGQPILLKFQAYPFEQYGVVNGKIEYINKSPSDSGYLVKVDNCFVMSLLISFR